mgnify:FL=1
MTILTFSKNTGERVELLSDGTALYVGQHVVSAIDNILLIDDELPDVDFSLFNLIAVQVIPEADVPIHYTMLVDRWICDSELLDIIIEDIESEFGDTPTIRDSSYIQVNIDLILESAACLYDGHDIDDIFDPFRHIDAKPFFEGY